MRAINRVKIPYVEVSRLTTMHICTYTITWEEREEPYHLYRRRFYGRPVEIARMCDRECVRGGSRRDRGKKSHRYTHPHYIIYGVSLLSPSVGVHGTHIPATSPLAISRREDTTVAGHQSTSCSSRNRGNKIRIPSEVIAIKCERFNRDDWCG